ncbi:MAG: branched-chain amino acid ABC transporter permease [Lachnospiraceae bacterium]|nr:branched-chain amino acid ABC transporter permease [Lachnospiraceae bacterium]
MDLLKKRQLKKFRYNLSTYLMIIIAYAIIMLLSFQGKISSLLNGLLVPFCTYSILAVSLNLVVGISGELSLGHAGFMCIGAFSSAIFTRYMKFLGVEGLYLFVIAIIIGAVSAAVFGLLIGIPVLRLKGDYLAIVTLAFGEIIKNIVNAIYLGFDEHGAHISLKNAMDLGLSDKGFIVIKGAQGITGTPHYSSFTAGVILLLIVVTIILNLINSRTGRNIKALRDNRIAAESVGISAMKYKLIAFIIASSMAGVAGVLYAHNLTTLTALPKNFGYNMSITILVFVVLGGMGKIRGSIIAAVILTLLPEMLRSLQDYRMLIYSIVLICVMIFTSAPSMKQYIEVAKSKLKHIRKNFSKNKEGI